MLKKILILLLIGASVTGLFLVFKKENIPVKTQIIVKKAAEQVITEDVEKADKKCSFSDTKNPIIMEFCDLGIIKGYPDGTFRPLESINRAELVTILYRYFSDKNEVSDLAILLKIKKLWTFPDISPDHWAAPYISLAKTQKLIDGYQNGLFEGHQAANRAEAWKILAEAGASMEPSMKSILNKFTENDNNAWFDKYYNFGAEIGMKIPGAEEQARWLLMAQNISRQEVVKFLSLMMELIPEETDTNIPEENTEIETAAESITEENTEIEAVVENSPEEQVPDAETNIEDSTFERIRRRGGEETEINNQPPQSEPIDTTNYSPAPADPSLSLPIIIGFSSPFDVLNPGDNVRTLIEEQIAKGVKEIPIYMGGNVTPDGRGLSLAGVSPDLQNFMNLLDDIEATLLYAPNTLRIRPYIRASLTLADLDANPSSPGKVSLSDLIVRSNLKILINQIANGQIYNIDGGRIDEITLDFEDITASNFDEEDVAEGDLLVDSSITTVNNFILELKQSGFTKKIGLYSLGVLNQNWFPSTSYFAESPRNFISVNDLSSLFQSGLDVFEFAAYSIFPISGGPGGLAEQNTFGPIHTNYQDFVVFHIQTIQNLGKNPAQNLRIILPVYTDPSVINLSEAISTLQNLISSNMISKIIGGVFDFGSLDDGEKTEILNAQN